MVKSSTTNNKPAYNDIFIRIILSLIAAHFIVVYGDTNDIGTIIRHFNYYNALVVSFIIAFLVLYFLWLITRYLDRKLDWLQRTNKRIAAQFLLGIMPPALLAAGLASIYFRMYGYKITETPYFSADFPVILLLIFLANIYYFLYYLIATFWPRDHPSIVPINTVEQIQPVTNTAIAEQDRYRKIILVHTPLKSIPVPVKEIGYFFRENKQNYLRKIDGEVYEVNTSLDELEAVLDPKDFFRINRQMIICFSSCKEIRPTAGPRLELELLPAFNDAVLVSETKVTAFKSWIER